ncbi:PLP-dependent aminotransferase family protein [Pseudomonas koreensis]|uniref:PLP-dependent aminotransferase family protein n=2 Tax=Pseudomonas TaxID=286 RepID=A0A4Q4L979_9PSED|nr:MULTISPECIES: PLP-dependent aminotransferase family protein [Pseudomonas]WKV82949.1 PLP-dependent aminotransferase family protein [Pseudomonas sp. B24_DOA]KIF55255.1 GntR family transcriptional regulator [Pseudomonas fluorescens]MDM8190560.1 PLP-dependent aminotransferase family protein [Pseudomonas fluorescens]MDP8571805.1 PLP-dependent aminotransferase family protein [Pseudomonas iranensis]MDR7054486.1 DNA-binding transcriptional MocR family regulator [Pseudomonas koreensis]
MELRIDRQAMVPVVQQVVDGLTDWIVQSGVPPATRLPSVRQIARGNLLSQSCVVEACERLVSQGVLTTRQGSGFIVAAPPTLRDADPELAGFEGRHAWCSEISAASGRLKLGQGSLPSSWREPDDLSYALREVARTDMDSLFNYSSPLGLPALREQIVRRLKVLNIAACSSRLMSTSGASHALDLIVRTLFKAGDCVVVETPGHAPLFDLLRMHGIRMLEVRRTSNGPDVEMLESVLRQFRPGALFIGSHHHNPTGSCLTPAVAQRIVQLSKRYDLQVIEDDVYADLHTGNGTRLAALDHEGRVIYVGSFSKTLSSSLRVGFVLADSHLLTRLAEVKMISGMGCSRLAEAVLARLMATGAYRKLVQRQRQRLNADRAAALQALEDAEWEVFGKPVGGLFIWARARLKDQALVRSQAQHCGLELSAADAFSPSGEAGDWHRINVACACDPRARQFLRNTCADRPPAF